MTRRHKSRLADGNPQPCVMPAFLSKLATAYQLIFNISDVYCILCQGKGTSWVNMDIKPREVDGRRPAVCKRCAAKMADSPNSLVWCGPYRG